MSITLLSKYEVIEWIIINLLNQYRTIKWKTTNWIQLT